MMVSVFKNIGGRCMTENYHHVSLLSAISDVFQKLVNTIRGSLMI